MYRSLSVGHCPPQKTILVFLRIVNCKNSKVFRLPAYLNCIEHSMQLNYSFSYTKMFLMVVYAIQITFKQRVRSVPLVF